ncbi:pentatricopeptide repeat-containing protein At2g41720 isoform X1 [Nicotiana tomentosiformis]|uniref:pentatricopeptide repeat-containing protein At2g41720 isoform X1 n=1 Tax=Nicotiana tomentosiformis TaxID=4098 RepID=UPI000878C042|nr:pentatricopeptide repeat-containing protein At2g41720 isoform X1 [Nicotiana tomentosiformis]
MATIQNSQIFPQPNPTFKTHFRTVITVCQKQQKPQNKKPFEEKKLASVDYNKGTHKVTVKINGFRKSDLPKHQKLRVQSDRFQKDWAISEVVEKIMKLNPWDDDIEGLLNCWVGRFARKNFPNLIKEITQMGSIEHSIQVFNWMKNQKNYCARSDIYNMMIRLHARHNRVDQARGLFFEMQKWRCQPNVETYNALISAHGRAGQWRWAKNIMEDMLRAAIPPNRSTYNNLINACGSSGNWREALKVCKEMTENGVGPDLVTHNIVLSAYKNGEQYAKALSYFELMKGTKVRPDTTTLNIVIHCLVKLGEYEKAVEIFNSMRGKRAECNPDIVTFTTIMHMYSVSGQIKNCEAAFNTMIAEGLKPNIVSYNTLVGAYASHGMAQEALSVVDEMKNNGIRPDVVSYTSLLNAYGRSEQPERAMETFERMKRNNLKPNLVSYNVLIDAYGSNGLLDKAVQVLREMEHDGLQPNVVTISTLLAASGRCSQKVNIDYILTAAKMRGIELNTVAYNSALGSYLNVGEYEKAFALYRSMRKKKVMPDSVTYNVLISGCCRMSNYSEALEFLDEMIDLKIPLTKEVCSSAICAYTKQGQFTKAESMFSMMKMEGFHPDVIAYTTMLNAYSVGENWEKAFAVFQEMELNDVHPDAIACSALMRSFNRGCQPDKVLLVADFMRERNIPFTEAVLFELVSASSILRDWRMITDIITIMEASLPYVSVGTLNQLLHSIGKSGKTETMIKFFYKVVTSGAEVNLATYSVLLKNLLAAGNWRKYVEVLEWMEDGGIQPASNMYEDILFFAQHSAGTENAAVIKQRLGSLRKKSGHETANELLLR